MTGSIRSCKGPRAGVGVSGRSMLEGPLGSLQGYEYLFYAQLYPGLPKYALTAEHPLTCNGIPKVTQEVMWET